ncbi:hypothetical protein FOZ63_014694, partial [Perkinsus olseni]
MVRRLLHGCGICQRTRKAKAVRRALGAVKPPGLYFSPGTLWVIDLQGPFLEPDMDVTMPKSKRWALTCYDPVTCFLTYDILDSPNSDAVTRSCHRIFSVHGVPRAVVVDAGTALCGQQSLGFLRSNAVAHATMPRSSKHYAGFYERCHGLLLDQVRARLLQAEQDDEAVTFEALYGDSVAAVNKLPLHEFGGISAYELYFS